MEWTRRVVGQCFIASNSNAKRDDGRFGFERPEVNRNELLIGMTGQACPGRAFDVVFDYPPSLRRYAIDRRQSSARHVHWR